MSEFSPALATREEQQNRNAEMRAALDAMPLAPLPGDFRQRPLRTTTSYRPYQL